MKPSILKISGLNSFSQTETIDFERLTSRGLFGIFGPTGSGKSTILDAITLALYGEVARETKSYINSELDKAHIYFEFFSGHGKDKKKYIIERSIKRSKTGISTPSVTLERYDINDNLESIIEKRTAVENELKDNIIKLNFEDFIRTVVLPQGKFSEFLTLTGGERNNMLERILGLEEYGKSLTVKINNKKSLTNDELNCLYGELGGHDDISEDTSEALKKEQKEILEEETKLKKNIEILEEDYKKSNITYDLQQELDVYTNNHKKILENKEEIIKSQENLEYGKSALHISPYISTLETSRLEHKENDQKLESLTLELKNLNSEIEIVDKDYKESYSLKEKLTPKLIEKRTKIANAIDLETEKKETENLLESENKSFEALKKYIKELNTKLEEIIEKKTRIENEIETVEKTVVEKTISSKYRDKIIEGTDIEKSYNEKIKSFKQLEEDQNLIKERIKKGKIEISKLDSSLKELKTTLEDSKEEYLLLKKELFSKEESLKVVTQDIENIKEKYLAKTLAQHLEEDSPCPVCGSKDHPDIVRNITDDNLDKKEKAKSQLDDEIQELRSEISLIESAFYSTGWEFEKIDISELDVEAQERETEKNIWQETSKALKQTLESIRQDKIEIDKNYVKYNTHLENIEENVEQSNKVKAELEKELTELKSSYSQIKEQLKVEDIAKKREELKKTDEELEELNEKLKKNRYELKEIDNSKIDLDKKFNESNIKIEGLTIGIKSKKELIEKNNKEIFIIVGDESPNDLKLTIEKQIEELTRSEKTLKASLENLREKDNKFKNEKLTSENNKQRLISTLEQTQETIDKLLEEYNFLSIDQVKQSSIDKEEIETLEETIETYKKEKENISSNIKRVENLLDGKTITQEQLDEIKMQRTTALKRQEEILEEKGKIVEQLNEMTKNIKRVKQLRKDIKKLELRKDSLDEIHRITKGKKFVEFVSRSHLDYIARSATEQLKSITRERYGLVLNEENTFEVIDNHSGGVRRDSSSLSGGETFLVSLALALALSTKIQLKGDTSMEFFFLDEGFGTLDVETLDTAMTALENLYTENLSIGIISHVEEIKNRVPIKLIVSSPIPGISGSKVKIIKT